MVDSATYSDSFVSISAYLSFVSSRINRTSGIETRAIIYCLFYGRYLVTRLFVIVAVHILHRKDLRGTTTVSITLRYKVDKFYVLVVALAP